MQKPDQINMVESLVLSYGWNMNQSSVLRYRRIMGEMLFLRYGIWMKSCSKIKYNAKWNGMGWKIRYNNFKSNQFYACKLYLWS